MAWPPLAPRATSVSWDHGVPDNLVSYGYPGPVCPVALKAVGPEIVHRTDVNGLVLDVKGGQAVAGAVVDCLLRLSQLSVDQPEIQELDVNPLMVTEKGAVAVDVRVVL